MWQDCNLSAVQRQANSETVPKCILVFDEGDFISNHGLNLTCFDQCHGVRFHGASSSQGWRKRIILQSTV